MPNRLFSAWTGLPRAVRLILANYLAGAIGGLVLGLALIATNAQGLGDLIRGSAEPWLPAGLFLAQMAFTFAALAAGVAIMRMAREP